MAKLRGDIITMIEGSIDCRGLSGVLTVLRIKQAVVDRCDGDDCLAVVVDQDCNCRRLVQALHNQGGDVRFLKYNDGMIEPEIIALMSSDVPSVHV